MEQEQGSAALADATDTSSSSRDEIMSHFQEITNFYDVEQSQAILESTNWNLDQAIQSFFNGDLNMITEPSVSPPQILNHQATSAKKTTETVSNSLFRNLPSYIENEDETFNNSDTAHEMLFANGTSILGKSSGSSTRSKRLLTFNIEFYKTKFQLYLLDNNTIMDLKKLIEEEIKLPVKNQKLKGFRNKDAQIADHMELSFLNLPLENNLYVINTDSNFDIDSFHKDSATSSKILQKEKIVATQIESFELNIGIMKKNETTKSYRLQFDSNVKFLDLKRKISKLVDLNVYEQEWWFRSNINSIELNETSLEKMIESGQVLSLPLTVLIKNDSTLNEIKEIHDNLTDSNTKIAASNSTTIHFNNSTVNVNLSNSKLTPEVIAGATSTTQFTFKLSFLVTHKTSTTNTKTSNKMSAAQLACSSALDEEQVEEDYFNDDDDDETFGIDMNSEKKKTSNQMEKREQELNEENELDGEDGEDGEDLDDNFILDTCSKQKSLIPSHVASGDEFLGTTLFVEEFFKRYQPIIPLFYIGSLESAIKEALLCSARNRKLLGIYLHNDKSVCRHIFCSKTLCDENVVNFLISNFIVWGWDLTFSEHEQSFFTSCSKFLGSVVANHLKTNKIIYPAFLIVNRMRGTNEVIAVIEGDASQDTMINRLMQSYEMFESQRIKDEKDENTRDERERIKREQDAAYQQSLEMDKAKRQKQTEEVIRQKQAAQLEEEKQKQIIQQRDNFIKSCLTKLKNEPDENSPINTITRIRFRLPNGEFIQRKFFITDKLEQIIYFINGNGYLNEDYKLLSSWPRKDLTSPEQSQEQTIEELKLFPQETLTVEKRS